MKNSYEVTIIGAGVIGSATLFTLSKYTNVKKIALIEKYNKAGMIDSNAKSNSQTLHYGDIETDFNGESMRYVKSSADKLLRYKDLFKLKNNIIKKVPKMVLGVGKREVKLLKNRFTKIKKLYPDLKKLEKSQISKIEPKIVEGRDKKEEIITLYNPKGYMVNYGELAQNFINNSKNSDKQINLYFDYEVYKIEKVNDGFKISFKDTVLFTRTLLVDSGAFSLKFAKQLGYGKEYSLLTIAGNFYFTPKYLKSKVYTVHNKDLPLAGIHGDPDILEKNYNRYGPTTIVVFMLERHNFESIIDYFRSFKFNIPTILSLIKILSNKTILKYVITNNLLYNLPLVGKYFFMKNAKKIIPTIKPSEIIKAKGRGGVKPQVINTKEKKLEMGAAKIVGDSSIFNISPSHGASSCMNYAYEDTIKIVQFLGKGYTFYHKKYKKELG